MMGPFGVLMLFTSLLVAGLSTPAMALPPNVQPAVVALEQDYRRCMYPMCGGYWTSAVNGRPSVCADGTVQDRCYVAEVDLSAMGLSADEETDLIAAIRGGGALLWGASRAVQISGFDTAAFHVRKAWVDVKYPAVTTTP